jgi:hypothetical protein
MQDATSKLLVLRTPADDENYTFRLAELPADRAAEVEQMVRDGRWSAAARSIGSLLGEPLNIKEILHRLPHQNYTVLSPEPQDQS